jgi:hypothetical protein
VSSHSFAESTRSPVLPGTRPPGLTALGCFVILAAEVSDDRLVSVRMGDVKSNRRVGWLVLHKMCVKKSEIARIKILIIMI